MKLMKERLRFIRVYTCTVCDHVRLQLKFKISPIACESPEYVRVQACEVLVHTVYAQLNCNCICINLYRAKAV